MHHLKVTATFRSKDGKYWEYEDSLLTDFIPSIGDTWLLCAFPVSAKVENVTHMRDRQRQSEHGKPLPVFHRITLTPKETVIDDSWVKHLTEDGLLKPHPYFSEEGLKHTKEKHGISDQ